MLALGHPCSGESDKLPDGLRKRLMGRHREPVSLPSPGQRVCPLKLGSVGGLQGPNTPKHKGRPSTTCRQVVEGLYLVREVVITSPSRCFP